MAGISYEYKVGVRREVIEALRKVFGPTYPDPELAGRINVVGEYPRTDITYPMVLVKFSPGRIHNAGIGNYILETDDYGNPMKVLHWQFQGNLTFEVYAMSPLERDMVITGLVNLFAFGKEIPAFEDFKNDIDNYDYVALQLMTDEIQESGDNVTTAPWGAEDDVVFTDSITIQVWGDFFTVPTSGKLVQISRVDVFPYEPNQPIPTGSQEVVGDRDDRTVPWQ